MNWKEIDFIDMPGETKHDTYFAALSNYDIKKILPVSEQQFILVGSNEPQSMDYEPDPGCDAIVFTSSDGGDNFKKTILGKGVCERVVFIDSTYYITVATGDKNWSSYLVKADADFKKWKIVSNYDKINIDNLFFINKKVGVASFFSFYNRISENKYTYDGGVTWHDFKYSPDYYINISRLVSETEVEYLHNNNYMKYDFITGEEEILAKDIYPKGCKQKLSVNISTCKKQLYVSFTKEQSDYKTHIKFIKTNEIIKLPKGIKMYTYVAVHGDYIHAMNHDGPWYNYIYSTDRGKTWHTEKLRDFFVTPNPIAYYGKGQVYAEIDYIRAEQEGRGARLGIRQITE
ncbi:hypothetical protein [Saccharicrinis fermentans]|uniref:hypothetical protein n=2 Tax=Saccharicrinis fermentans TaxID=982 RepID=UPI00047FBCE1|nr:hypothetical protein [Saccharicrinis fermentans]